MITLNTSVAYIYETLFQVAYDKLTPILYANIKQFIQSEPINQQIFV